MTGITRNFLVSLFWLGLLSSAAQAGLTPTDTPLAIEEGVAQLFVDDYLIADQENLKRTLRQPRKDDGGNIPVVALQDEFGEFPATLEANGTIVYDPKLKKYVMYALGYCGTWGGSKGSWDCARLYRFTSVNGFDWIKGDKGRPQLIWPHTPDDLRDAASGRRAARIEPFSCYYDTKDDRYPYKAWLFLANSGPDLEGIYFMRSADGINWELGRQIVNAYAEKGDTTCREILQAGRILFGPQDVSLFYHDAISNRFLGIFKFYSPVQVENGNLLRCRAYAFLDRIDKPFDTQRIERIALLPAAAKKNGDMPTDEYYASTGWRYESLWLGGLKVWHPADNYPYSAAGCAFLKLAVSRDGLHWNKVQFPNDDGIAEVWIPNGPEGGNGGRNDGGYFTEFSQGPLRLGDELIYYYACSSYGKNAGRMRVSGGGVFRARLRIDGFVSVDRGTLTTKPLAFCGNDLFVNFTGRIQVLALDGGGKVLGSAQINGDWIQKRVAFSARTLREVSPSGIVRLCFVIGESGHLYSFTIGHHKPVSASAVRVGGPE